LNAGQKIIQVPTDILMPISERAILNIEGEIYFLERDYTIDTRVNTITLKEPYSFNNDSMYEIIDPLPPTYVKEQIQEFIDDFKQLVSNSKVDFEALKERVFLEIQQKVDDFYTQLENYIEENKEKLKGHSIDRIIENGQDENGGNIYDIFRDDDRKIGTITAPQGDEGVGVVDVEYVGLTENGDTEYKQVLSNGQRTEHTFISPKGQKGEPFYIKKVYPSIAAMEADFETDNVKFGEYAIISSNDDDNAKLFEKRLDGFFFTVQMAMRGKSAYESWLELGNEGTEEDFINSLKGVGIIGKEFVRKDAEGNYVYRDIYSDGTKSSEYISPRGPRGYTGGIVGLPDDAEPQPPMTDIYGTIIEHHGSQVPEGWALCNGAYLSGNKYPHLLGMFDDASEPLDVRYKFIDYSHVKSNSSGGNGEYWSRTDIVCGGDSFHSRYFRYNGSYYNYSSINTGLFFSNETSVYNNDSRLVYNVSTRPDKTSKEILGYISDLEIKSSRYMYLKAIAFDGENFEYGGILPNYSSETTGGYNKNLHPDIYFNIEYIDEDSGDWRLGVQLHNKTDFIKSNILDNMYIAEIKTTFKTKKIRLSIDLNKSTPHYPLSSPERVEGYGLYFLGRFHTYIDDVPNRENMTVIKLPNLKDSTGRYKLVYIGQPLEITEPTMYSYSKDNIFNGEVPLSLAVNNELPNYTEGITMTEPQPSRMGYTNKYNNDTDTWELVKTHLDKEGYYYDEKGDLKYIYKPHNWFKWDFETHTWIEDTLLKEEAKNELLNKYIELELKKDKIIQLKLNTEDIEKQIKIVKQ
ncbi:phage tail protein, partial [Cetobacterium sp.]|uniref:phage tail protein n=1 Tax=Cetobacterium sp. TaxID=2071632 RepID=UPI003AF1A278